LGRNEAEPFTVIQRVSSPGLGNDSLSAGSVFPWYHLPVSPKLSYRNNSISFVVKGIYLKDPDAVLYSYQLAGYDTGFSVPASQSFFNFQNLEPGHYIFRVRSMLAGRPATGTITEYRFSVATPFHKSKGFLILVTAGLILTGIMIQFLYNRTKQRRQQQLELLRQEELQKVRQRTSEDFHDELGNKLARISLLADILQKKVRQNEPGKSDLIRQISANVQLLYAGTKDIIWSLSPGSDDLPEVLKRIEQFGTELFHDSEIDFSMEGLEQIEPGKKLPIGHSHNLIMIFKELLNNCLRHARSASVKIIIKDPGNNSLLISLQDNGTGFDPGTVQKGNGLNNIQRRAQAIGAIVDTASVLEKGTVTTLIINIPSNGG
jgi:signal transduction histidine kinase